MTVYYPAIVSLVLLSQMGNVMSGKSKAPKSLQSQNFKKAKSSKGCPCFDSLSPDDFEFGYPYNYFECSDFEDGAFIELEDEYEGGRDEELFFGAGRYRRDDPTIFACGTEFETLINGPRGSETLIYGFDEDQLEDCIEIIKSSHLWKDLGCDGNNTNIPDDPESATGPESTESTISGFDKLGFNRGRV